MGVGLTLAPRLADKSDPARLFTGCPRQLLGVCRPACEGFLMPGLDLLPAVNGRDSDWAARSVSVGHPVIPRKTSNARSICSISVVDALPMRWPSFDL